MSRPRTRRGAIPERFYVLTAPEIMGEPFEVLRGPLDTLSAALEAKRKLLASGLHRGAHELAVVLLYSPYARSATLMERLESPVDAAASPRAEDLDRLLDGLLEQAIAIRRRYRSA